MEVLTYIDFLKDKDSEFYGTIVHSLKVIQDAFLMYSQPREIAFSFNGGKDSTVVVHLLRAVIAHVCQQECAGSCQNAAHSLDAIRIVYFSSTSPGKTEFPEVFEFLNECQKRYNLSIEYLTGMQEGFQYLVDSGVKAVVLGTRAADPAGRDLLPFSPTSNGWPAAMRVNPVLNWSYAYVWKFLRDLDVPICSLYEKGYTSLGAIENSKPNPLLRNEDGSYSPAWFLQHCRDERNGRH